MKYNVIQEKSFLFALMIVGIVRDLETAHEYTISKQLLKSGTSIGANVEEAIGAESRKDFHHKVQISLKEARETKYWLRILANTKYKIHNALASAIADNDELIRILSKITKTLNQ